MKEQTVIWKIKELGGLEVQKATYTHSFTPHFHEEYSIGIFLKGAQKKSYRGETHLISEGQICLMNPGEVHSATPVNREGWTYRVLYASAVLLRDIYSKIMGTKQDFPVFTNPVIDDIDLFDTILNLHLILENPEVSLLEKESVFVEAMEQLILKYANMQDQNQILKSSGKHIKKVKAYLDQNYGEEISIELLSELTNLSPYYLLRLFKKEVGATPHIYLTQRRINKAKEFLTAGDSLSEVAYKTGFVDQSHFTNRFKNIVGVTPGQYIDNKR